MGQAVCQLSNLRLGELAFVERYEACPDTDMDTLGLIEYGPVHRGSQIEIF